MFVGDFLMFNKVNNLIKGKDLIVSNILFYNYEKLELNFEDLYYLTYLMNNSLEFDISKICSDLNKKPKDIIKVINKLDEMDILDIEIIKKGENDIKEIISLEKLYKKLTFLIVEKEDKIEEKVDLESEFKDVFKRDLTPREKQILNAWKSVGYNDLFILICYNMKQRWSEINALRIICFYSSFWLLFYLRESRMNKSIIIRPR